MAWEEPRKTGMAYRRLGKMHDHSMACETRNSNATQAIRVCMCPCSGWADGSRTYPQVLVQVEVYAGDLLTVPSASAGSSTTVCVVPP
jgi:hypothetical protein